MGTKIIISYCAKLGRGLCRGVAVVLCMAVLQFPAAGATDFDYEIATAGRNGLYFRIGLGVAEIAEHLDQPLALRVVASEGSVDNLARLSAGEVDFALVQNDIAQAQLHSAQTHRQPDPGYKLVASLYTETVQICVRKCLHIEDLTDLRGKRISIGARGSGTEPNALAVMGAAGITLSEIEPVYLSFTESADSLEAQTIDAAFFTAGVPHPDIDRLLSGDHAYLLGLDAKVIKKLAESYPYTVLSEIRGSAYSNMEGNVSTVGVTACLVSSARVPDSLVVSLLDGLFEQRQRFTNYFEDLTGLTRSNAIRGIDERFMHTAAIAYYGDRNVFAIRQLYDLYNNILPAALLVFLIILVYVYKTRFTRFLHRREITRNFGILIVGIPMVLLPTGVALFYIEHNVNDSFGTLWESIWSIVVYLVSGFEDRAPLTNWGRFVALIGILGGVIISSLFTAVIAAIKVKGLMMRNGKVGRDFKNHVVILGWNEKGAGTLEEILKWGSKVAILCKEDEQNIRETIPPQDTGEVVVLKGRPDREENLKKLRLEHANSVLILSTKHGDHLVDDMTAHIILSLRGYLDDLGLERGRPHIVAEIRSPEVVRKMRRAGADEIVCTANLGKNLLVNCTVSHGVSRVFEDLLTKSASTNEVYLHTVPEQFLGQSYGAFCRWVGQHEVDNDPIIPLGIRKSGDRMRTNPRDRESLILEAGDELILMAYNQKSLTTIEKAVVTASELT